MDPGPVRIFASGDVPRLRYVADLLIGELMGLRWEIITDKRKLGKNPVINYSSESVKGSFRISPHPLLFETGYNPIEPVVKDWRGLPVFFEADNQSDLPFDIFAASFFLVSRYEEYGIFSPDKHGRFPARHSFSYRNGFLSRPVVDLWVKEWIRLLVVKLPMLVFKKNIFSSYVTFDVDQPFEYLGKDMIRNIGGLIREIGSGKAGEHYRTLAKGEKDPWDVFDYIFEKIDATGCRSRFFIPLGDRSARDVQPSWQNDDYRRLITRIAKKYETGIHPSFEASENLSRLKTEQVRFRKITGNEPVSSRFHYLRLRFPGSYRNLAMAGIKEDFSMGYHDEPGFRAGIARPFLFYDLHKEQTTELRIFPFQVMDVTLYQYRQMSEEEAGRCISEMINETRNAGGLFITIWHNTSLLGDETWAGWRRIFERMLTEQQ